jgi:hypothetical protein
MEFLKLRAKHCSSLLLFLVAGFSSACTTIENDPTTASPRPLFSTRVDFEPPNQEKRDQFLEVDRRITQAKLAEIQTRIDGLDAERARLFAEIRQDFPECENQGHCISDLAKGSIKRFERYREIHKLIGGVDLQLAEVQNEFDRWKRRGELRERAIYNRYLVAEMLKTKGFHPNIENILVHSLEAFPNRESLSRRLIQLIDPWLVPAIVGDLNFQMMGKPIDEAAVIATFDVLLFRRDNLPAERFLITFLVNSYQLDPQFYEKEFLKLWSKRLAEPGQKRLSEEVFCGLFSIASETLLPRLDAAKGKTCRAERMAQRDLQATKYLERIKTESWLLPIHYVNATKRIAR